MGFLWEQYSVRNRRDERTPLQHIATHCSTLEGAKGRYANTALHLRKTNWTHELGKSNPRTRPRTRHCSTLEGAKGRHANTALHLRRTNETHELGYCRSMSLEGTRQMSQYSCNTLQHTATHRKEHDRQANVKNTNSFHELGHGRAPCSRRNTI